MGDDIGLLSHAPQYFTQTAGVVVASVTQNRFTSITKLTASNTFSERGMPRTHG
jgi:hypothetical protein